MLGPNSFCGRVLLGFLILFAIYFIGMDYLLYLRVQNYLVRPTADGIEYQSIVPCDIDPLCVVTTKGLMLDHPNHYLLSPLATIVDRILGISSWTWISPNMISGFHVMVAIAAGKCVSSDSLSSRRIGVFLFQIRTWLDDLDGHVARKRKNISGEHSDVGSTGYWVDGICDALGCIALMIGAFVFLRNNPPRRGYEKLVAVLPSTVDARDSFGTGIFYKKKISLSRQVLKTVLLLVGQLTCASVGWNRYISLYQDLLETNPRSSLVPEAVLFSRQTNVFRSSSFWGVLLGWRLINFHAAIDYFLLAIFLDKIWEYMKIVSWSGYVLLLTLIYFSEFHFLEVYAYVHATASSSLPTGGYTTPTVMNDIFSSR